MLGALLAKFRAAAQQSKIAKLMQEINLELEQPATSERFDGIIAKIEKLDAVIPPSPQKSDMALVYAHVHLAYGNYQDAFEIAKRYFSVTALLLNELRDRDGYTTLAIGEFGTAEPATDEEIVPLLRGCMEASAMAAFALSASIAHESSRNPNKNPVVRPVVNANFTQLSELCAARINYASRIYSGRPSLSEQTTEGFRAVMARLEGSRALGAFYLGQEDEALHSAKMGKLHHPRFLETAVGYCTPVNSEMFEPYKKYLLSLDLGKRAQPAPDEQSGLDAVVQASKSNRPKLK